MKTINKVLVIEEQFEGQFECRGEKTQSLVVFNLDKLDAISKSLIESRFLKEWTEKHNEEIDMMNGVDWSFEDFEEEISLTLKDNETLFHREIKTFDLTRFSEVNKFLRMMSNYNEKLKLRDSQPSDYVNEHMLKYFSEADLESADITGSIEIKNKTESELFIHNIGVVKQDQSNVITFEKH